MNGHDVEDEDVIDDDYDDDFDDEDAALLKTASYDENPIDNATPMRAGIVRRVTSTRYGQAQTEKVWVLSNSVKAIFAADDLGEAVFASDYDVLLEELETRYPAPPGFTFFIDARKGFYNPGRQQKIVQYEHPIAREGSTWETILPTIKDYKKYEYFLVPRSMGLPPGSYRSVSATKGSNYREDARYTIDDKCYAIDDQYHRYFKVYYDPKTAKKLLGYKKLSEKRREQIGTKTPGKAKDSFSSLNCDSIPMGVLRELHNQLVRAVIGPLEYGLLKTKIIIDVGGADKNLNDFRKTQIIRQITYLRKMCIRLKRNWRVPEGQGLDSNYYSSIETLLSNFYPWIKVLVKSKNEHYAAFGRWLKIEKLLREKRIAQQGVEIEEAKQGQEEELPIGVRRPRKKEKTTEFPVKSESPKAVAATPIKTP